MILQPAIDKVYRARLERALIRRSVNNFDRDEDGVERIQCPVCENWFKLSEIKAEMEEVTIDEDNSVYWCLECLSKR
jgi:hypothetical protein